jgi:hypothetical protein
MASLLQLHGELMEEKERRVDLYRRLSEKDEALAELRYQVKLLEDRLRRAEGLPPALAAAPQPSATNDAQARVFPVSPPAPAPAAASAAPLQPLPERKAPAKAASPGPARAAARREDWRQW